MEFSRQEYWNGVQLPTPGSCPTIYDTMDCSPWNSPGQNTGVGSLSHLRGIFPIQGSNLPSTLADGFSTTSATLRSYYSFSHYSNSLKWSEVKVTQLCPTVCDPMDCSPWNSPGQNAGVGSLSLLQGIFPTQGSNPGLLDCRQML